MTITRKVLSAAVALSAALTLTAAPAYASISVHKASQQFRADMLAYIPAFKTFDRQFAAWAKKQSQNPNVQASSAGYIINPMVKATASLGHKMRTQQWPAQYLSDVQAFEADTTTLREDFSQFLGVDAASVQSWANTFGNDATTWGNDGQTVQGNLHASLPESLTGK